MRNTETVPATPPQIPPSPLTLSPKAARAIGDSCGTANREDAANDRGQAVALAPFGERDGVRRPKPRPSAGLGHRFCAALVLCLSAQVVAAEDPPRAPLEVHEWSVWVGNPAQTAFNASRIYRDAMPNVVGTSRPKYEEKELAGKFPVAPDSVVQFFGDPARDIDVDIRAKKGTFLAHWPKSTERGGRLQYFKSDLSAKPPADIPLSYLPPTHWFQKLRDNPTALYLKHENLFERFIAYDVELTIPVPVKIRGGPDEYTLQNLTNRRLLDVAVIAPGEAGYRVGWLDVLPTAGPEKNEDNPVKKTDKQKAETVLEEAGKKTGEEEITPLPAEGDPSVRARVDQIR